MNNLQPHKYLHIHTRLISLLEVTPTPSGLCCISTPFAGLWKEKRELLRCWGIEHSCFLFLTLQHTLTLTKTRFGCWPHSAPHFLVLLSLTVRIGRSVSCLTFHVITKQALQTGHLGNNATPLSLLYLVSSLQHLWQRSFQNNNQQGRREFNSDMFNGPSVAFILSTMV